MHICMSHADGWASWISRSHYAFQYTCRLVRDDSIGTALIYLYTSWDVIAASKRLRMAVARARGRLCEHACACIHTNIL